MPNIELYILTLETMDPTDHDFQAYLREHGIDHKITGIVYAQPGGGEEVIYSSLRREALTAMVREYWGEVELAAIEESIRAVRT